MIECLALEFVDACMPMTCLMAAQNDLHFHCLSGCQVSPKIQIEPSSKLQDQGPFGVADVLRDPVVEKAHQEKARYGPPQVEGYSGNYRHCRE